MRPQNPKTETVIVVIAPTATKMGMGVVAVTSVRAVRSAAATVNPVVSAPSAAATPIVKVAFVTAPVYP